MLITRRRTKKVDLHLARTKDMRRRTRTTLLKSQLARRAIRMSRKSTSPSKRRKLILIKNQSKMWPLLEN
jgi:hypothetical protein